MNKLNQQNSCSPLQYLFENITEYVLEKLGERCAVSSIIVPTAIIYGLILLIGLFGNICTCLVILKNKSMQNPTNYYLFSLAVSDLLILTLGLPMELYGVFDVLYPYKFGEFVCKGRAFLIEFTSYASILTITCFSVERWLAICFPLRIKLFSTLDRAIRVIIAVWICAFIAALPVLDIVVDTCALDFHRPLAQRNFILTAFFLFFLLPALLITLVYCHILQCLCSSVRSSKAIFGGERAQKMRSRKSLLKILASRLSLPPPPTIISSSKLTTTTNNRPLPQLDRYAWEQFCGNTMMTMAVGSVTSPIKTTNFLTRKRKNGSSTNVEKQKTTNSKNRRRDTTPADLTRRQLFVEDSRPFLEKRNLKT
uniref:G-protein coupled receptors family 1 profile domain-containing protein n=1 Tax=Meloidogyne javanica TaxID=6303 RepID=A0A915MSN5_MELJA